MCHKCYTPCPVKIDFGDVTMNMRNLLRKMGKKSLPRNKMAMAMLNATNPDTIKLLRSGMVNVGFKAQRMAVDLLRKVGRKQTAKPLQPRWAPPHQGAGDPLHQQEKLPGGLPKRRHARCSISRTRTTSRSSATRRPPHGRDRGGVLLPRLRVLNACSRWAGHAGHAVARGRTTVLPPGYLCCGYPQRGSGQFDKAEKMITGQPGVLHRVANTLNYLDIKTVVVSCGTCYDQLQGYQFDKIFPGCRIIDIHEYLLEKGHHP